MFVHDILSCKVFFTNGEIYLKKRIIKYTFNYSYIYIHTYTHTHIHTQIHPRAKTYARLHIHTHVRTYLQCHLNLASPQPQNKLHCNISLAQVTEAAVWLSSLRQRSGSCEAQRSLNVWFFQLARALDGQPKGHREAPTGHMWVSGPRGVLLLDLRADPKGSIPGSARGVGPPGPKGR